MSDNTPDSPPESLTSRFLSFLRNCFLTGIVVTAPVGLSLYIVWSMLLWIDKQVDLFVPPSVSLRLTEDPNIPGLGIFVAISFFVVIGALARNYFGQLLLRVSDFIMERLPVVKTIYGALKQVLEMLTGKQAQAFREVVMIEYPRKDMWTMGFLTGRMNGEIKDNLNRETLGVFIPTTPVPSAGFLVFVPEEDVIHLKMSVDEGLKMIVSCGMIKPKSALPPKGAKEKS
ncbi:MAG: DUF502 domain-containing protein [Pseudobdellovibrionaceae bacterium]